MVAVVCVCLCGGGGGGVDIENTCPAGEREKKQINTELSSCSSPAEIFSVFWSKLKLQLDPDNLNRL